MKEWIRWGSTMTLLIGWIALTCLWAGGVQRDLVNDKAAICELKGEIITLNKNITETNKILYKMLGEQHKGK